MRRITFLLLSLLAVAACGGDAPPEKEKQTAWASRLGAYTEQAWADHAETYRALVDAPRSPDPSGRPRYPWATDRPETLRDAGPLLLAMLTDDAYDEYAKADALTVLPFVASTADTEFQELLLAGSRADSGGNLATRRRLAQGLALIATPRVPKDDALAALRESVEEGDATLARLHLETVSRIGAALEEGDAKDELVGDLQRLLPVGGASPPLTGASYLMQRVALIGGRSATAAVLKYLDWREDADENAWGVDLAPRLAFSERLAAFLKDAMYGREGTDFGSFHDDALSRWMAVNAWRDLVRRFATGDPLDKKVLGAIKGQLADARETDFDSDARLAEAFAGLVDELDEALGD